MSCSFVALSIVRRSVRRPRESARMDRRAAVHPGPRRVGLQQTMCHRARRHDRGPYRPQRRGEPRAHPLGAGHHRRGTRGRGANMCRRAHRRTRARRDGRHPRQGPCRHSIPRGWVGAHIELPRQRPRRITRNHAPRQPAQAEFDPSTRSRLSRVCVRGQRPSSGSLVKRRMLFSNSPKVLHTASRSMWRCTVRSCTSVYMSTVSFARPSASAWIVMR